MLNMSSISVLEEQAELLKWQETMEDGIYYIMEYSYKFFLIDSCMLVKTLAGIVARYY